MLVLSVLELDYDVVFISRLNSNRGGLGRRDRAKKMLYSETLLERRVSTVQ